MSDWVERRALRQQNLSTQAADVWQAAIVAVENSCNSFRKYYATRAQVLVKPQNGHRLLVNITLENAPPGSSSPTKIKRLVAISFAEAETPPTITVTVDNGPAKTFQIEADEQHCYICFEKKEVSPDEFSRLALEDALFKEPQGKR